MNQNPKLLAPITCWMLLFLAWHGGTASAQDDESTTLSDTIELKSNGVSFNDPIESVWEFGLNINAPSGARGVTATVPIPMEWPEQEIEILAEQKSDNVGKFVIKNPTKHTRQFTFKINRLTAGRPETVLIRFKVKKRQIVAPLDPAQFVVAAKVPSKIKTFLKPSPLIESNHKRIREIANSLLDDSLGAWDQVEKNFRWVRDNIEYQFEKQNYSCLRALDVKHGDCGELSSLFIAICRAQGIPARAVWIPEHTYPEFYLNDQDGNGHWFPCQAAGTYQFGAMSEPKPILQKGDRFRIPGQNAEVRYLRPTAVARQAPGGVSIEWISRQINPESPDTQRPNN